MDTASNRSAPSRDQENIHAKGGYLVIVHFKRLALAGLAVSALALSMQGAFAETLFKVITVKDEIIVGLNDAELKDMGGDAAGVAKTLASKGTLSLWQYAVKQAADGERQMAPLHKVGLLANSSLRVEPYKQPFKVLPHE
jgi:hypothetical protein